MNSFLLTRDHIDQATRWLQQNNYTEHPISCKNYEMAEIIKSLHGNTGSVLDMGADGSFILHNLKNARRIGIDLAKVEGINKAEGAEYFQGDLMSTPFSDEEFDIVVSQSVIEHSVDLEAFAKEASRLLKKGGRLIVTFDYSEEKLDTSATKLYNLDWNVLSKEDVLKLLQACGEANLALSGPMNWTTEDMVINSHYCAPADVEYTFGLLEFIKQ